MLSPDAPFLQGPGPTWSRSRPQAAPRPRVLVVEDEPTLLRALQRTLRRAGMDVTACGTAAAALSAAATGPYDCAVLDFDLPDGNGLAVGFSLRARAATRQVVFFTGRSDGLLHRRLRALGRVVHKSEGVDRLLGAVDEACRSTS